MDGDAKFTMAFRTQLAGAGIERFMRSIESECLDRMIVFCKDSLRRAVRECVAHDHAERNRQELGNAIVALERRIERRVCSWTLRGSWHLLGNRLRSTSQLGCGDGTTYP